MELYSAWTISVQLAWYVLVLYTSDYIRTIDAIFYIFLMWTISSQVMWYLYINRFWTISVQYLWYLHIFGFWTIPVQVERLLDIFITYMCGLYRYNLLDNSSISYCFYIQTIYCIYPKRTRYQLISVLDYILTNYSLYLIWNISTGFPVYLYYLWLDYILTVYLYFSSCYVAPCQLLVRWRHFSLYADVTGRGHATLRSLNWWNILSVLKGIKVNKTKCIFLQILAVLNLNKCLSRYIFVK